jgi:zinc transport system permease protein
MYLSIILSVTVLVVIYLFFYDLLSISFNEEQAQISGIKVTLINYLLVILTAVSVVLSIKVVGIMLISSLLILPAVTSLQFARSFQKAILFSSISAVFSVFSGILISFFLNFPTGATIVMVNFILFLTVLIYRGFYK